MTFVYNPTRREVLKVAGAAVAVAATANAVAEAQMAGGKIKAIGFDAFTIFDVRSIDATFEENFPGRAKEIAATWRTRLFEYTWLRTLNRTYADLEQVSEDALTFACKSAKIELSPEAPGKILDAFLQLKPFPDSVGALKAIRGAGIRLAYVSDFTPRILKAITENVGVADLFEHQLSTDAVKAFKPDPRAYQMAETAFKLPRENIVFAAFGGWDAAGAKAFGYNTFWANRFNAPVEELTVKPDAIGNTLSDLAKYVMA